MKCWKLKVNSHFEITETDRYINITLKVPFIHIYYQTQIIKQTLSNKTIIKNYEKLLKPPILKVGMKYENLDGNTELNREQTDIQNIDWRKYNENL